MTQQARLGLASAVATALAACGLFSVFTDGRWLWRSLSVLVVAVLACHAGRRVGLPKPLVPVLGLLATALTLVAEFAGRQAWVFIAPNRAVADRMHTLVQQANDDIRDLIAPVPTHSGTALIAAAGVGLIAVAVDTLAVTYRRPALAVVPLVGLLCVPALVAPDGVTSLAFVLAAAGYLGLLLMDSRDRISRWGRTLERSARRDSSSPVAAVGRRVGVAAIGAAVLVPVVLPGLDDGIIDGRGLGRGGGGNSHQSIYVGNPILKLDEDLNRPDPYTVITYQSSAASPGYLRLVSLDNFTKDGFAPAKLQVPRTQLVSTGLGNPTGLDRKSVATDEVTTNVVIDRLESSWLPLPYPSSLVEGLDSDWVWDQSTFNVYPLDGDVSTKHENYRVTSLDVQPTAEQLRAAKPATHIDRERFTALPDNVPKIITDMARQVTADASTDYDKAVALQTWLRSSSFAYDTEAPSGNGLANIANFLQTRRGYCVHFASTMAVMARTLGIPARVAVGFTAGSDVGRGTWEISTNDAHAWPELYFEGAGWLKFEPTPSARTGATTPDYTHETAAPVPTATASAAAVPTAAGPTAPTQSGRDIGADVASSGSHSGGNPLEQVNWTAVLIVLAVLALLAVPGLARMLIRRRRWARATTPAARADAAWAELQDLSVDYGFDLPDSLTPRQFAARLREVTVLSADGVAAAKLLARARERAQYAPTLGDIGDVRAAVTTLENAMRFISGRWTTFRARALPASVLAVRHPIAEGITSVLDRADRTVAGLTRSILPQRRRA